MIVSTLTSGWGDQARGGNRYFAFDKRNGTHGLGQLAAARHYDTNYSTPIVRTVDGRAAAGGRAAATARSTRSRRTPASSVWQIRVSKRAILTSVVVHAARRSTRPTAKRTSTRARWAWWPRSTRRVEGELTPDKLAWRTFGIPGRLRFAGDRRRAALQMDNGAVWRPSSSRRGKGSGRSRSAPSRRPRRCSADGKLYSGTENGKVYILKPGRDGRRDPGRGPARHRGRARGDHRLAGRRARPRLRRVDGRALRDRTEGRRARAAAKPAAPKPADADPPASPPSRRSCLSESLVKPGEPVQLHVRLYDAKGHFVREEPAATWTLDGLEGRRRRRRLHAGRRRRPAGGPGQGHGGRAQRDRARARDPAAAVELRLRERDRRGAAAATGSTRPASSTCATTTATKALVKLRRQPAHQARPAVHRARRLVRLHRRGGRARERAAPPDGRRRRDRAALRAGAVRQQPAARAAARGRPNPARTVDGALRLEAGDLVPASSCAWRTGRTARPRCRARPGPPPSPSPRRGRSTTSTRCRTGRAPPASTPTRRPRSSSTTSRSPRTK